MIFTKRKFQRLEKAQQHKKCLELLRDIYNALLDQKKLEEKENLYNTFLSWMHFHTYSDFTLKPVADRYHWHLKEAKMSLKEHNLLPHIRKGDHVPKADFLPLAIYLDHLRSAYNVGNILRTMEALRIGSLYFSKDTPFIDNEKVLHTSMGAAELVPCYQGTPLSELPRPWIALETSDEAVDVSFFPFPPQCTLILGNEEYGVSDEVLLQVDALVEVPLFGKKNSINVASAFAIAAATIRRQLAAIPNQMCSVR